MSTTHHPEDRRAAFTGLIVGAIALIVIIVAIVTMTNARIGAHEKPTAEVSK